MTDLKTLSAAATGGEWIPDAWEIKTTDVPPLIVADVDNGADAALICAAINGLRAGELVEAGKLRELVKEMRAEAYTFASANEVPLGILTVKYANALAAIIGEGGVMGEYDTLPEPKKFPATWWTQEDIPREVTLLGTASAHPDVWVVEVSGIDGPLWLSKQGGRIIDDCLRGVLVRPQGPAADEIDALRKERDALRARVEVLEGALGNINAELSDPASIRDVAERAVHVRRVARAALEGKE